MAHRDDDDFIGGLVDGAIDIGRIASNSELEYGLTFQCATQASMACSMVGVVMRSCLGFGVAPRIAEPEFFLHRIFLHTK